MNILKLNIHIWLQTKINSLKQNLLNFSVKSDKIRRVSPEAFSVGGNLGSKLHLSLLSPTKRAGCE